MKAKKAAAIMLCAALGAAMVTGVSVSAKDKDELVLYTWDGMVPQEVLDDFEKETGTKVVYSNFDTDETMLEKLSQAKGGDYDVVIADDYIIDSAVKEGLVQKIDKDTVTNFGNINPLFQGQFYDPDDEYTVPYGAGIPLIVYDPDQVDIDIKGYKDLWDESLKDSVAIIGNYRVIAGITQNDGILSDRSQKHELMGDVAAHHTGIGLDRDYLGNTCTSEYVFISLVALIVILLKIFLRCVE